MRSFRYVTGSALGYLSASECSVSSQRGGGGHSDTDDTGHNTVLLTKKKRRDLGLVTVHRTSFAPHDAQLSGLRRYLPFLNEATDLISVSRLLKTNHTVPRSSSKLLVGRYALCAELAFRRTGMPACPESAV